MASVLSSRISIGTMALAGLALTPVALRAQTRPSEAPVIVQVVVQQPASLPPRVDPALLQVRWGTSWYPATRLRTVWGPYTLVRFDGYGAEWDSIMHERDVRPRDERSLPPWQSEVAPAPLPAEHVVRRGDALMGEWRGSWYPVHVLRVRSATHARIRYDGFGSEWDEDMSRARLRLRDPEVDGPAPAVPPQDEWIALDAQSVLRAGQRAVVRQGSAQKWATITRVDGPVLWVHYRGTSLAFDEPVTLDRLAALTR